MVGAGGVPRCRPDALVALGDERGIVELLAGSISPELRPHPFMQPLRERLGESVGKGFGENGGVVVVRGTVAGDHGVEADPGSHGEETHVVRDTGGSGRDEVRQREVRTAIPFRHLLPQRVDHGTERPARLVGVELDVVSHAVRRKEAEHRARGDRFGCDQLLQHALCVVEQVPRGLTDDRILQDRRVVAAKLPRLEERRPVDAVRELGKRIAIQDAYSDEGRAWRRCPLGRKAVRPRDGQGRLPILAAIGARRAERGILIPDTGDEVVPERVAQEIRRHADRA